MKRVIVIGSGGAGKSTLATALGQRLEGKRVVRLQSAGAVRRFLTEIP